MSKRTIPIDWSQWDIVLSASQLETFAGPEGCERKWWFLKCARLPVVEKHSTVYGDVVHEVARRYLEADEHGRGADGRPVDLYPPGWHQAYDRDGETVRGEVTLAEQKQIRTLIDAAIEEGMLTRRPGRKVEEPFLVRVAPRIALVGNIDMVAGRRIEDHKTTKQRRYAKSRAKLKENIQMRTYAAVALSEDEEVGRDDTVTLQHNYYIKEPDHPEKQGIRPVEVEITAGELVDWWQSWLVPVARKMHALKTARKPLEAWSTVPGPIETHRVCNAFGGCPFLSICGRRETPQAYKERVKRILAPDAEPKQETSMSSNILDVLGLTPGDKPAEPLPQQAAPQTAASAAAPPPEAAAEPASATAPWAMPGCKVCQKHPGFARSGQPCFVCASAAPKGGRPLPEEFEITAVDGGLVWQKKDDATITGVTPFGEQTVRREEDTAPLPATPAPAPAADAPAPAPESAQAVARVVARAEAEADAKKGKRGRKPAGFVLLFDVMTNEPKRASLNLAALLRELGDELAREKGVESYYLLNAFERRDLMAAIIPSIVERLGSSDVFVSSVDVDARALAEALAPYAARVYRAVAR